MDENRLRWLDDPKNFARLLLMINVIMIEYSFAIVPLHLFFFGVACLYGGFAWGYRDATVRPTGGQGPSGIMIGLVGAAAFVFVGILSLAFPWGFASRPIAQQDSWEIISKVIAMVMSTLFFCLVYIAWRIDKSRQEKRQASVRSFEERKGNS